MTYSRDKAKFKVSAEKWTVVIIKGAFKPLSAGGLFNDSSAHSQSIHRDFLPHD